MIKGVLKTYDGREHKLPSLLEWELCLTGGVPCDSFRVKTVLSDELRGVLPDVTRFLVLQNGETLFRGVVDEYELSWDGSGETVTVSGRGMAALLLDNESERKTYQNPTMQEILNNHVLDFGVALEGAVPAVAGESSYVVESGSSQWKALSGFTSFYGGFVPHFTPTGLLCLRAASGRKVLLGDGEAVLQLRKKEKRYGILSEVLVIDKSRKLRQSVQNKDFIRRGGNCRRVVYMPGRSSFAAMRYTGEYQIRQSEKERLEIELTLGRSFAAFPGDEVELKLERWGVSGVFRVQEAESRMDGSGESCRLILKEG